MRFPLAVAVCFSATVGRAEVTLQVIATDPPFPAEHHEALCSTARANDSAGHGTGTKCSERAYFQTYRRTVLKAAEADPALFN
jgi:hypothetical protein